MATCRDSDTPVIQKPRAHPNSLANLKPIQPGETRNPGGKPEGSRNRLQGRFLQRLADDFEAHGKAAIEHVRETDPSAYIRAIVALMPKELEIKRDFDELNDEQLSAAVLAIRAILAAQAGGEGAGAQEIAQSAPGLPALSEAG